MVADGGVVKAKLILDSSEFSSGWKNALKELNGRINGPDLSGIQKKLDDFKRGGQEAKETVQKSLDNFSTDKINSKLQNTIQKLQEIQKSVKPIELNLKPAPIQDTIRKIRELGDQSKKTEEQIKQINTSRFDRLVSNLDSIIRKMKSTADSGVRSIKNSFNAGVSSVDFSNLSTKFSAVIQKMQSTAASGAKSIANEFSNMQAGLTDVFAAVAGGAGLNAIFTYGMGRATTQAMLANSKSAADASTIMQQYQAYTVASSTPDTDIQRVLKYVLQGAQPGQTYRALSAIDAAAFTPDPIQRQELLRNFGQYLNNGYSAALFRGDVTAQEAAILQGAQTPEERIAAMEQIAKMRGSMTETGENLSTLTTGPMANYNKALIIADTLLRGMTDGFNKFMDAISPLMDWFINLSPEAQTTIGNLIFFAGVLGMAGGAVKILGSLFKPFISIFKLVGKGALEVASKLKDIVPTDKISSILGKLKDIAGEKLSGFSDKVSEVFSGLKDKISTPLSNFKQAVVDKFNSLKDWIRNKWNPTPPSTPTPTKGSPSTPTPAPVGGIGTLGALGGFAVLLGGSIVGGYGLETLSQTLGQYTLPGPLGEAQKYGLGLGGALFSSLPGFSAGGAWGRQMAGGEKFNWMEAMPGGSLLSYLYKGASSLLPGAASAAGTTGKQSISKDIFGKGGLLDFSRFKIPQFKWPSITDIKNGILGKLPKISLKLPSVNDIINSIKGKIPNVKWNIPNVGQILGQTWQKIKELWWQIPNPGQFLNQTWQKIKELWWDIPNAGSILALISRKIGEFHWPWGPGSSSVGQGSSGGGGKAFGPPRGPATDTVVATMAARSGVGSGYIANAMANRFSGLAGFRPIANGMAAPLHYEFYFGDQKTNRQIWESGGTNCYDGAQFLQAEASQRFGLGAGLANGVWDGTGIAHTWSVIGGAPFDMAAKLIRGYWHPPSGPNADFANFMTDIGPGLEYMAYGGHLIDPMTALSSGGNCFDMSLGVMGAASLAGLPSELIWGRWNNQSHVWTKVAGTEYDPARRAISGTYSPPPQGPGINQIPNLDIRVVVKILGPVTGIEDLNKAAENAGDKAGTKIASRIFGHYGG